jgi:hypothetical protein
MTVMPSLLIRNARLVNEGKIFEAAAGASAPGFAPRWCPAESPGTTRR